MKKQFLAVLLISLSTFGFAQKDKQFRPPPPPVAAKGCEYARDVIRCTSDKIYKAAFQNLSSENIQEIINAAEKDTLKVSTKLRFTSKRNLYLHRTSIRFYEGFLRLDARINSDVPRLPFTVGDYAWLHEGNKYASSFNFRLLVDREQKTLLPLYNLDSEKRTKKKKVPDQFMQHPKCSAFSEYESLNECFHEEVKKLIVSNFNSQAAKKAGVPEIVETFVYIGYDEEGKRGGIDISHKHPFVVREIERILELLPNVKPATLYGTPRSWYGFYEIKFKI